MIKILFICHGNICRSPMAEYIMKHLVDQAGLKEQFAIDSAAVSAEEQGNPVYPPARRQLEEHGIPCGAHKARRMKRSEYQEYDIIVAMDASNVRLLLPLCAGDPLDKIHLLLEYTGENRDVSDPWYTRDFTAAWNDIYRGCQALLKALK